jgi:hypothetical protein
MTAVILQFLGLCRAENAWVLCHPESYVVCRKSPNKNSQVIGAFYVGDAVITTGRVKNGYAKLKNLPFEYETGWLNTGYLVNDPPQEVNEKYVITSNSTVLARRNIGGAVRRKLKNGASLTVYWSSPEWSVTSQGFIKTDFIGDKDP